ncbi:hypothetical protein AGMMS49975_19260 [Clostridia bacterium]|nr:hypothetical protein AGMMS49975_19260 [Clostridia bacterium]
MPTLKPRFTITVPDELLKDIDDYRFENRYQNRTQAVLALMKEGIKSKVEFISIIIQKGR